MILQHHRYYSRTSCKFWNIDTQFGRASHYINHPANLPTIQLTDTSKLYHFAFSYSSSHCIINDYHLHYSLLLTFTPTRNSSQMEPRESVIFQPILQAYPTRHSWIITAHVSLGNLEHHWKLFSRQLARTQQFLRSLDQHPSAPSQLPTTVQLELSNIQDMYKSSKTSITFAINLLNSNQLQTRTHGKRSLLPFLGDPSVGSQELPPLGIFIAWKPG